MERSDRVLKIKFKVLKIKFRVLKINFKVLKIKFKVYLKHEQFARTSSVTGL